MCRRWAPNPAELLARTGTYDIRLRYSEPVDIEVIVCERLYPAMSIVLLGLAACGDGLPEGLDCRSANDCAEGEICHLDLVTAGMYFDINIGGTGGERCNRVEAGRCEPGPFVASCSCYFGPHDLLNLPEDGRGHLVCVDFADR